MSGYDETNPETYRPAEPSQAADGSHPGVGSRPASSQGASAAANRALARYRGAADPLPGSAASQ